MSTYQDIPWPEDEHGSVVYPTAQRDYHRSWRGMPLRKDWNNSPFHKGLQTCRRCGYKWDQQDFVYRDGSILNGEPSPAEIHETCWNCWMADTNSAQVNAIWDAVDRQNSTPKPSVGSRAALKYVGGVL